MDWRARGAWLLLPPACARRAGSCAAALRWIAPGTREQPPQGNCFLLSFPFSFIAALTRLGFFDKFAETLPPDVRANLTEVVKRNLKCAGMR